jgi:hypothetical protein
MLGRDVEKVEDLSLAQVYQERDEIRAAGLDVEVKIVTCTRLRQMVEASKAREAKRSQSRAGEGGWEGEGA